MEGGHQFYTDLINGLCASPFASNVGFGFILMGLEKLVELEFECPCSPTGNKWFSSAFFIIPAVVAFMVMLTIQLYRCDTKSRRTVVMTSFVPVIVWLVLVFLDGQYFACAKTDWHGRFVILDKAGPQKWCEPTTEGDTHLDLMLLSQRFFVISQGIGMGLLLFGSIAGVIVYLVEKKKEKNKPSEENKPSELVEMNINQEEQQPMRP